MGEKKIVPSEYIPDAESRTITIAGKDYLEVNDAMFTFYRRSMGELSPFFLALRDEKKVLGCKCIKCGMVRVPPFMTRCPDCNFAPTELVEVEQVGVMNSTPPITYFATSIFQHMAPFGRGRVILKGADTALSINVYTTTGILVPGLVRKGTEVKVIFRDNRIGGITDIFCMPTSELTKEQIARKGLQESELDWGAAVEPGLRVADDRDVAAYKDALEAMQAIAAQMNETERARKDIAGWKRSIQVKTTGGQFAIEIDDGDFRIEEKALEEPDFVMVCEDAKTLLDGLAYRGALTDSIIMKKLWISKNMEFTTIFKLDRMARSLARAKKT
ncbi:MAG: hypothetical protein E3J81_03055 [Dehalococcoidia bacterium]|nr:MAG: hypothetical protein E3J81_03055 [Dehalococcoidia bacterium]